MTPQNVYGGQTTAVEQLQISGREEIKNTIRQRLCIERLDLMVLKLSVRTIKYCNKSLMTARLRWADKTFIAPKTVATKNRREIEINM